MVERERERERDIGGEKGERDEEKDIVKRGWDMLLSVKAIEASKGGFSFSCLAKKMCKGVELILALQINESQIKRYCICKIAIKENFLIIMCITEL